MANIAVIGAGVIGLTTAVTIQEKHDCQVTLIADKFLDDTTSICAAGYFRPEAYCAPNFETAVRWARASFIYFNRLAHDPQASAAGVSLLSGYQLSSHSAVALRNPLLEQIIPVHYLTSEQLKSLSFPAKYRYGYRCTSVIADPSRYLTYLMDKFTSSRGILIRKRLTSLSCPFLDSYDVVVNCTGLGGSLVPDDYGLVPIRGQVLRVKAPWIKRFVAADTSYIVPGADGWVTLGGTKDIYHHDLNYSIEDEKRILTLCTELEPSLAAAEKPYRHHVGLRPHRSCIRLERQVINGKQVIHNYGHSAHGYAYSRGTAEAVVDLIQEYLLEQLPSSILSKL